jgi:hypothetical protein
MWGMQTERQTAMKLEHDYDDVTSRCDAVSYELVTRVCEERLRKSLARVQQAFDVGSIVGVEEAKKESSAASAIFFTWWSILTASDAQFSADWEGDTLRLGGVGDSISNLALGRKSTFFSRCDPALSAAAA